MELTIEKLLEDFNFKSIEELEKYIYELERTKEDYKALKQELFTIASQIERRALTM